jgi:acyl-CoA reductase-like NAD-dependent aldehyde dehydrogenase
VTGAGATGAALAKAAVDKIAFTGSAATGKRVMMAAAEKLTPVLLELGGKDPMIVAEDADLDKAAEACVYGALTNAGQACISVERVYVAEAVHDKFVDKVIENVRALKTGGDDGDLGAMTSPAQVAIVKDHLTDAVAKGAKVKTGGVDAISGSYIQPTVLTDVTHAMKVMSDETFGPVIPIQRVGSLDEAVKLANDTVYGLGSTVFAGDASVARKIGERIRAGMTSVNSVMGFAGVPSLFGGIGDQLAHPRRRRHPRVHARQVDRRADDVDPDEHDDVPPAEGHDEAAEGNDQAALRRGRRREGRRLPPQAPQLGCSRTGRSTFRRCIDSSRF